MRYTDPWYIFLNLWDKAKDKKGYDKEEWLALQLAIVKAGLSPHYKS